MITPSRHAVDFKVLMEGLIIPASSIQITEGVNMKTEAVLTVPFNFQAMYIRPRTNIAVFYRYRDVLDSRDENKSMPYVLLFSGEVVGLNYAKSQSGRQVSLSCVSHSNQFDYSYVMFTGWNLTDRAFTASQNSATGGGEVQTNANELNILTKLLGDDNDSLLRYAYSLLQNIYDGKSAPYVTKSKLAASGLFDPSQPGRTRLSVLDNDLIKLFVGGAAAGNISGSRLAAFAGNMLRNQTSSTTTVWQHFMRLFPILMMDYMENSRVLAPGFIFKPLFYYGAPPRCNVIFPYQYHTLSYSNAFMSSPTRMWYRGGDTTFTLKSGEKFPAPHDYVSPAELNRAIRDEFGGELSFQDSYTAYTAEEAEKGVLPSFGYGDNGLDAAWMQILLAESDKDESYLHNWMDFKFYQLKMMSRQISLDDMTFSPNLLCGFPTVILDPQIIYTGYINKVIHMLSADGRASTRAGISYAKNIFELTPGTPFWLRELVGSEASSDYAYSFHQVGDQVYKPNYGCQSIKRTEREIERAKNSLAGDDVFNRQYLFDENLIGAMTPYDIREDCNRAIFPEVVKETHALQYKIYESALATYLEYLGYSDRVEFAETFSQRTHTTFAQYTEYYREYLGMADQKVFEADGICDLKIMSPYPTKKASSGNSFPAEFLRHGAQEIAMCYRSNLNKIMRDMVLFDPELARDVDSAPPKAPESE